MIENRLSGVVGNSGIVPFRSEFIDGSYVTWSNVPREGLFRACQNGIWRTENASVNIGKSGVYFDLVGASLKSHAKESRNVPSADQIMCAWLTPTILVVGVADGIMPIPGTEHHYYQNTSEYLSLPQTEAYKEQTGEDIGNRSLSLDAIPSFALTKLFPSSSAWQELAQNSDVRPKDILIAADKFISDTVRTKDVPNMRLLPESDRPATITSLAFINFALRKIYTAHIGDSIIEADPWKAEYAEVPWDQYIEEKVRMSRTQGEAEVMEMYGDMKRDHITRGSARYIELLRKNYELKRNKTVGIMDGDLNPDLIIEAERPIDETLALLMMTDGADFSSSIQNWGYAYSLLIRPTLAPLNYLKFLSAQEELFPYIKDDDAAMVLLSFHETHRIGHSANRMEDFIQGKGDQGTPSLISGWQYDTLSKTFKKYKPNSSDFEPSIIGGWPPEPGASVGSYDEESYEPAPYQIYPSYRFR